MADEKNEELESAKKRFKTVYDRLPFMREKLKKLDESWANGITKAESLNLFKRELWETIKWLEEDYNMYVKDV